MAKKAKIVELPICKRATTYPIAFTNTDANGAAISLVGATVRFTAKLEEYDSSSDDATAAIKKDVTSHSDAANGETLITLTPTDTDVAPNDYYFDITVEYADGVIVTPIEGKLTIDGKPTNRRT